jgi:hypothetical protein
MIRQIRVPSSRDGAICKFYDFPEGFKGCDMAGGFTIATSQRTRMAYINKPQGGNAIPRAEAARMIRQARRS